MNNLKRFTVLFLTVAATAITASATNISLIGQMVDAKGVPIEGVAISIGDLKTVSDEDGNWMITGVIGEQAPSISPSSYIAPILKGSLLNFSATAKADLRVFDASGRVVAAKTLGAGQYSLNIFPGTVSASGLYLVRLIIDDKCFIFKKTRVDQSQAANLVIATNGNSLAKKTSTPEKIEMTIEKDGLSKSIVINPYLNKELGYVGALGNIIFSGANAPALNSPLPGMVVDSAGNYAIGADNPVYGKWEVHAGGWGQAAVYGENINGYGLRGVGATAIWGEGSVYGVYGTGPIGVAASGKDYGVRADGEVAVYGEGTKGGIYGKGYEYAGFFDGKVFIKDSTGNVTDLLQTINQLNSRIKALEK